MYRITQDIVLGVFFHQNINHEFSFLTIFIITGLYNLWFCYDLFKRIGIKFLWPRLTATFLIIIVLNKFNFDYLSLAAIYLLQ